MSVFADKKYENLDWISAATEPFESKINVIISKLPDIYIVDYDAYVKILGGSWNIDASIESAIRFMFTTVFVPNDSSARSDLSWAYTKLLNDSFEFEIEGNPTIDFKKKTINGGTLKIVKTKFTIEDDSLKKILGEGGMAHVSSMNINTSGSQKRANEVMDLVGSCEEGLRTTSSKVKRRAIRNRISKLFRENEWRIKDTELADKVGIWISDYIDNGNISSFVNLCKLKVMTHSGNPIYSIEEVK